MAKDTRQRILLGAIELIRERGINAASSREIVRCSGTPRGSLGYYFPQGRAQLLCEALTLARHTISQQLKQRLSTWGAVEGLVQFVDDWHKQLEASHFSHGCPIMAAATEGYLNVQGLPDASVQQALHQQAATAFSAWQSLLCAQLRQEGVADAAADSLAALSVASWEGALARCQVERSGAALADITTTLTELYSSAISASSGATHAT